VKQHDVWEKEPLRMDLEVLIADLQELRDALDNDDLVAPERLRSVALGARDVAGSLSPEEGQRLSDAISGLSRSVGDHRDRMGEKLRELGQSRKAMRGYGGLRSHRQGQKIRTKA
jgi:hypothetical protein